MGLGPEQIWIIGPIVSGVIILASMSLLVYTCVRRCRLQKTLATQVVAMGPSYAAPATPVPNGFPPPYNNSAPFNNSGFAMAGGSAGGNFGNTFGTAINRGMQNAYDPLYPTQNGEGIEMGLLNNNF